MVDTIDISYTEITDNNNYIDIYKQYIIDTFEIYTKNVNTAYLTNYFHFFLFQLIH